MLRLKSHFHLTRSGAHRVALETLGLQSMHTKISYLLVNLSPPTPLLRPPVDFFQPRKVIRLWQVWLGWHRHSPRHVSTASRLGDGSWRHLFRGPYAWMQIDYHHRHHLMVCVCACAYVRVKPADMPNGRTPRAPRGAPQSGGRGKQVLFGVLAARCSLSFFFVPAVEEKNKSINLDRPPDPSLVLVGMGVGGRGGFRPEDIGGWARLRGCMADSRSCIYASLALSASSIFDPPYGHLLFEARLFAAAPIFPNSLRAHITPYPYPCVFLFDSCA
jgi:hypothetical protein